LLRTVKDSQYFHFFVYFIDSDEGQRSEQELASTFNAARASAVWKRVERGDPHELTILDAHAKRVDVTRALALGFVHQLVCACEEVMRELPSTTVCAIRRAESGLVSAM
jgi:hypothetical protein